jgi:hypothetical protein
MISMSRTRGRTLGMYTAVGTVSAEKPTRAFAKAAQLRRPRSQRYLPLVWLGPQQNSNSTSH